MPVKKPPKDGTNGRRDSVEGKIKKGTVPIRRECFACAESLMGKTTGPTFEQSSKSVAKPVS